MLYTFLKVISKEGHKDIAVLVRDGNAEALRMALGLTVLEDKVSVFVMDVPFDPSETVSMSVQGLKDMGVKIYTNCCPSTDFEEMTTEDIARGLVNFDVVIPY